MGKLLFVVVLISSSISHSLADADITFHGSLVEYVPCMVGGEIITVDFGDEVMTTRIEDGSIGGTYTRTFLFSNDCPSDALIRYQIKGPTAYSDDKMLVGDRDGLGFRFWHLDYLTLNDWFTSASQSPIIYVTPARLSGAVIEGGAFSTVATLLAEYQ